MVRWMIEGSQPRIAAESNEPLLVSEPFLTEEGARHFAILLTTQGYVVAARTLDEDGQVLTMADAALVDWMKSE